MAHLLLQQGQQVQGVKSKDAQVKVGKVSIACQTDDENEEPEVSTEREEFDVSEASWGVAQLKAKLEQEKEAHNDS